MAFTMLTGGVRRGVLVACSVLFSAAAFAGPLSPPAGPVTSTYKTLTEIEPRIAINATNTPGDADSVYRITQSGSYYLTGNIQGVAGKSGIEIAAGNVTVDLNGYQVRGITGSLSGIVVIPPPLTLLARINVHDGSVVGWGSHGVRLTPATSADVQSVRSSANGFMGISVGDNSTVAGCEAKDNLDIGVDAGNECAISDTLAVGNFLSGISVASDSRLTRCTSSFNSQGVNARNNCTLDSVNAVQNTNAGVVIGNECSLMNCVAVSNGGSGFQLGSSCSISNSASRGNTGAGFAVSGDGCTFSNVTARTNGVAGFAIVGSGCIVDNATCSDNTGPGISAVIASGSTTTGLGHIIKNSATYSNTAGGILVGTGCNVVGCTAYINGSGGIVAGAGCMVSNCTAYQNTGTGISVGGACSVLDCTARVNTADGILCSFRCIIRGNNSSSNTLAQIHATDTDNRIEANACTSGSRGMDVDAAGNIIMRNTCSGATTNWDIVAGNVCLVVNAATTSAAILGNSGGVAPGSTDPSANFTY